MRRYTPSRKLVRDVLSSATGPLSAVEVHEALGNTKIGIATVYRILNEGLRDGDLVCVELPSGPKRFEPADRPHHHHFECSECEKVYDVQGCPDGIAQLVPPGFELDFHEIILTGRCPDCVSTDGRAS